jgi:release factor glutamine methyltransferase
VFVDLEARRIVEKASGLPLSEVVLLDEVDPSVRDRALGLAERRARGEPLQYVTGSAGFRRLDLVVGPGVFIPRPETELVAEKAMDHLPSGGIVVDVGTGTGAIALAIKDERPDATVVATEFFPDALAWARKNMQATGLDVRLLEGDLFAPLPEELRGRVHVVVANPPYVPPEDAHLLPVDVAKHEPGEALFADSSGLALIARVAQEARDVLRDGGWLVMEIGDGQNAVVEVILVDAGYSDVTIDKDLTERPRIASARHDG